MKPTTSNAAFMSTAVVMIAFLVIALSIGEGCSSAAAPEEPDYVLTQDSLNTATYLVKDEIVGDSLDVFRTIGPKAPDTNTMRHSVRTVYCNWTAKKDPTALGAIFVRYLYSVADTSHIAAHDRHLEKIMIMAKHNNRFFPNGGDWEYVTFKDSLTAAHPNGGLPITTDTLVRGKMYSCAACHDRRSHADTTFLLMD